MGKEEKRKALEKDRELQLKGAATEVLFALLRYEMRGVEIPEEVKERLYDDELLQALYQTSKAHDLAHLVADALFKNRLIERESAAGQAFAKQLHTAIFRFEQIRYELESIRALLSEMKIRHLPLKGSVVRALYPEPWMRTSSDIDIYVREEDLDEAANGLVEKLGYRNEGRTPHDIQMFAPSGVHLELHYDLIEDSVFPKFAKALSQIWKNAQPLQESGYTYKMTDEDFYFYHIAHTAKHLRNGGCGIRAFIDLWYLEKSLSYDTQKIATLLEESGLTRFAEVARKLVGVWIDGEEHDELSRETETYILKGGSYGVFENTVAVQVSKGRFRYFLARVFPSYQEMTGKYPSLKKCPILYPFYIVRRWFNLLFVKGRAKNSLREWNVAMEKSKANRSKNLLKELGLHETDIK